MCCVSKFCQFRGAHTRAFCMSNAHPLSSMREFAFVKLLTSIPRSEFFSCGILSYEPLFTVSHSFLPCCQYRDMRGVSLLLKPGAHIIHSIQQASCRHRDLDPCWTLAGWPSSKSIQQASCKELGKSLSCHAKASSKATLHDEVVWCYKMRFRIDR